MSTVAGEDLNKKRFDSLVQTTLLLNSDYGDFNALLNTIVLQAMNVVSGEAASLLMVQDDKNSLRFEVAVGPKGVEAKNIVLGLTGIAGWVVKNNKSLVVNDVLHDSRFDPSVQKATGYQNRNMLACPMRVGGVCVGVIEVLNKSKGEDFNNDDLATLELFASQAALSYHNSYKFRKSNEEIINLQDQVKRDKGYHTMIAKSPVMLELVEFCKKIASSNASVLILGESGVGKELIAELLHLYSGRVDRPLVRVNCVALPEGLLESELFGHVKGAFTDAVSDRVGRFEAANTGTIFLDEIGELPLSCQPKLLRVLQNKAFERVGSSKTIDVDVRVIVATNRDLGSLVKEGKFRSDLYYRLNVFPITVPPLRERREDILELSNFFLKRFSREVKKNFLGFTNGALDSLVTYKWPGNVRELENAIERACVIGSPPYVTSEDLFFGVREFTPKTDYIIKDRTLKDATEDFKRLYIKDILKQNGGNRTDVARILDIQRTYLSKLIKELNIEEY